MLSQNIPQTSRAHAFDTLNSHIQGILQFHKEPLQKLVTQAVKDGKYTQKEIADICERDPAVVSRDWMIREVK